MLRSLVGSEMCIRDSYKTVWEIKQKVIIQMAADRGPFICQTQSMNLFFEEPTSNILSSALFYGWKSGLKTGTYYVRSQPKVQAQQFTVDPRLKRKVKKSNDDELKMNIMDNGNKSELTEAEKCARDNPGACDFCSG